MGTHFVKLKRIMKIIQAKQISPGGWRYVQENTENPLFYFW
jgi:hypothetical protein